MPKTARAAVFTPSVVSAPSQPDDSDFYIPFLSTPDPRKMFASSLQDAWKSGGSFVQSITPSGGILDSIGSAASGALNTVSSVFSAGSATPSPPAAPSAAARQNPLAPRSTPAAAGSSPGAGIFAALAPFANVFASQPSGGGKARGKVKGRQVASHTDLTPWIIGGGAVALLLGFVVLTRD